MILDDNSREISMRKIDYISLNDNKIVFHIKSIEKEQVKTYSSAEAAKEEFDMLSRRIEHYMLVKSGKPLIGN